MPAATSLINPLVTVEPGSEGVAELRIKNTGSIVDQFAVNLVGEASAWARCDPPVISLFPGAEESVTIRFTPPRAADVAAGVIAFGARVTSKEDPDFSQVEEGSVQVGGFSAVQMRVVPRTSQGKRHASHHIEVSNSGNAPITAAIAATDPDEQLAFKIHPPSLQVPAGATVVAKLDLVAREKAKGGMKRRGFSVTAHAAGAVTSAEAAFEQKPRANVIIWVAILIAIAALVFLLKG
jgi:uncharacterized membrane protein